MARPVDLEADGTVVWEDEQTGERWTEGLPPTPDEAVEILARAREASQGRARPIVGTGENPEPCECLKRHEHQPPIVYVSVVGGVADVGVYSADGTPIGADLAGVNVIQIDWDNVRDKDGLGDPSDEREYVKGLLDREELPPRLHNDIALSYDDAVEDEDGGMVDEGFADDAPDE